MTIDTFASKVYDNLLNLPESNKKEVFIDPLTMIMIGSIISNAISIIKTICELIQARREKQQLETPSANTDQANQILEVSQRGGILARMVAKRATRRVLGRSNIQLEQTLIKECAQLSISDIKTLLLN